MKIASGSDVERLANWFFILHDERGDSTIPYHRVIRIDRSGDPLWHRHKP